MTVIDVTQVPSEYQFIVTQECRIGQYDLVIIVPPGSIDWPDDLRAALADKPF